MKTSLRWLTLSAALLCATFAFGQNATPAPEATKPQEVVIHVQQDAAPAPAADKSVAQKANEWVEFGRNAGSAMNAGLEALTDNANKFAKTDAGKFTMAVIAWKVAGKDAMDLLNSIKAVVIGVPFLIAWTVLYIWFFRRNFLKYSVLVEKTGTFGNRVRKYEVINDDGEWSAPKIIAAAVVTVVYTLATVIIACNIIF